MKLVPFIGGIAVLTAGLVGASGCGSVSAGTEETAAVVPAADDYASADALLQDVVQAYRTAPTMVDTIAANYETPQGNRPYRFEVLLGPGHDAQVQVPPGYLMTSVGGEIYVTYGGSQHKYMHAPGGGNVPEAFKGVARTQQLPMHLALRWSDRQKDQLDGLSMNHLRNIYLTGFAVGSYKNQQVYELHMKGDNGSGRVWIEPTRKHVMGSQISYKVSRGRQESDVTLTATFDPKVRDALPETIAFDPADKVKVANLAALHKTSVGEPAPDFTLRTLGGETVQLSSLKGNLVVLDFWATWCGPCRRGLPLLEQFHKWSASSGHPIRVYAVDVWERHPTDEAKIQAVSTFWKSQNYTMPTLLDLDGTAVQPYGFSSIPTSIIIGPDGTIASIHTGYDPNMFEKLKKEAAEILGI